MFGVNFGRQKAGRPISARTINAPAEQAERTARLRVGAGLAQSVVAGIPTIRRVDKRRLVIRTTTVASGIKYGWQAIRPDPDTPGAWLDETTKLSGTTTVDPFYEFNLNATIAIGTRIEAVRVPKSGELRGQYDKCT